MIEEEFVFFIRSVVISEFTIRLIEYLDHGPNQYQYMVRREHPTNFRRSRSDGFETLTTANRHFEVARNDCLTWTEQLEEKDNYDDIHM